MRPVMAPDEDLVQRLPLPLAQLYRRSHNAKTALDQYLAAYYLWEAGLKLLACSAVVTFAEGGTPDPGLAELLQSLARPALGHWWALARRLVPLLADRGDGGFTAACEVLLGRSRDDCPRAAGLDALLCQELEGKGGARASVRLSELFERLVTLRNKEPGHGAVGLKPPGYYERMGSALLAGIGEVLGRLDVLAGRRLVHVADVRRLASGAWLVERYELRGESPRRLDSLEVPEAAKARLPLPGLLYLDDPPAPGASRPLHPLLVWDAEAGQAFFYNSRRGERAAEYLCYFTGAVVARAELGAERRELLARVLGVPVDEAQAAAWEAHCLSQEPSIERAPPPDARTLGEFELISRLGRGGMGVVYRAWQPSLGRQVALKCLLRTGDPKAEARFAREIRALGKVEHPGVVKVYTAGADGEQWFYAMEVIDGVDLCSVCSQLASTAAATVSGDDWTAAVSSACDRQRRQEEPLDGSRPPTPAADTPAEKPLGTEPAAVVPGGSHGHVERVVELVRQVAEAAHALHEAGVVHRDIKPGNVMLTPDGGHTVLMDLGLAQLGDEAQGRLTRTRQFVGTLRFASPEQLGGATVDRRSDIYSLGATLWELLTLRPLFGVTDETPTPDMVLRLQQDEPEPVRGYNPRVSRDLGAIVHKCLEKKPERRYATAAELAADLARWQRGEPVTAQPPSLGYLLGKWGRRHWVPLAVAAAILVVGVAGVVVAFVQISVALAETSRQRGIAEGKEQEAKAALERAVREQHERKHAEGAMRMALQRVDFLLSFFPDRRDNLYVVTAGVSEYRDPSLRLRYAARNAADLAQGLDQLVRQQQGIIFQQIAARQLLNADATRANLWRAVRDLSTVASPRDLIVWAFFGHVFNSERDGIFLIPHDYRSGTDPTADGISLMTLQQLLKHMPCPVLMIMDVALPMPVVGDRQSAQRPQPQGKWVADPSGLVLVSTFGDPKRERGGYQEGGLLTLAILEAMNGRYLVKETSSRTPLPQKDKKRFLIISLGDVLDYVRRRVVEVSGRGTELAIVNSYKLDLDDIPVTIVRPQDYRGR
jgi:serine/threonine protein kinase